MARRARWRAIASTMLVLYDEPFAGLDPISLGVVGQLIRRMSEALGITSLVVTHDVYESLKIVDYLISEARSPRAAGPRAGVAFVRQFVDGGGRPVRSLPGAAVSFRAVCACNAVLAGIADALRRVGGRRSPSAGWDTRRDSAAVVFEGPPSRA
jgi:ABC-type proline/glycine betaine transport system ATPase subunit